MWKMSDSTHCQMSAWWGNRCVVRPIFEPRPVICAVFGKHPGDLPCIAPGRWATCHARNSLVEPPHPLHARRSCLSSATSPRPSGISGLQAAGQSTVRKCRQRFDIVGSRQPAAEQPYSSDRNSFFTASVASPRYWHSNCFHAWQTADIGVPAARLADGGCECIHGNTGHALAPSFRRLEKDGGGQGKQKRLGSSFANQTVS